MVATTMMGDNSESVMKDRNQERENWVLGMSLRMKDGVVMVATTVIGDNGKSVMV
ncbi:hypothetical protein D8674_008446 [Pyrus ussuriensis x Pyrus communis]|uniref:Uncharacterized protein n=1 Tax=Pyrus ussuriensis x Pyrus communis TaxID=2448454 RepID=A0A5N5HVQ6_9ROSA|nr:hypothetical protein D8674_008446 [Pyrus ussuriensis x Pyrus communis]